MNIEDQNVTAKILSDIKLIRESFTRPTTDSLRSLTEMSQRIATGAYLVTQHMSDKVSIKMSVRSSADALVGVVYESGEDSMSSHIHNVVSATEKLMSYISIARTVGAISDINGLLIEREALKLTRLGSMMLVRGDAGFVENLARERSDVRLKISELFDVSDIDIKRTRTKQVEKITRVESLSDSVHTEIQTESIGHPLEEKGHSHNQPQYSRLNDSTVDSEGSNAPSEDLGVVGDGGVQRGGAQPQEVAGYNTTGGAAAHTAPAVLKPQVPSPHVDHYARPNGALPTTTTSRASTQVPQSSQEHTTRRMDTYEPEPVRLTGEVTTPAASDFGVMSPSLRVPHNYSDSVTPVNALARVRTMPGQVSPTELRRQQILQYIRENGIVSIKDIASGVQGVSDKTLQRALIELVNDKIIIRHGDRRWSRYEAVM